MKVIIEIEKDEEIDKIRDAFKGQAITVVRARKDKARVLDAIFKKYNVKLPKGYKFDRETIHAR